MDLNSGVGKMPPNKTVLICGPCISNQSELVSKDQFEMAERELSAFIAAVEVLFGPEQAKLATEDWLNAIEQRPGSNLLTSRAWRDVTIIAASGLADRMGTASLTICCATRSCKRDGTTDPL